MRSNQLKYFFNLCKSNLTQASPGYVFLESRDLLELIDYGYCSENIFSYTWMKEKNIDSFELESVLDQRTRDYLSNFFNRVIIPIYDQFDELVAVSGRAVFKEQSPKYYNSVYNKKEHLFLLNKSKKIIVENNYCVITEGYTDALRLYQYGIPAVAILSTSCSDRQMKRLLQYTSNIFVCLDDDVAGRRGESKILELGETYSRKVPDFKIKKVKLSDNLDPDEYILKYGDLNFKRQLVSN